MIYIICTFFGHRDTPQTIKPILEKTLKELINKYNDIIFYVGNYGNFDRMVISTLKNLSIIYKNLSYFVVLAYLPTTNNQYKTLNCIPTLYPEGIENVPKKYAISFCNKWRVKKCDIVISYITHNKGGAVQFTKYAFNQDKIIINLAEKL